METTKNINELPIHEIPKRCPGSVKITLKPYEILLFTLTLVLILFIGFLLFFNVYENLCWENTIKLIGYLITIYGIFGCLAKILDQLNRISYTGYQNSVRVNRFNLFMLLSTPMLIFGAMILIIGVCLDLPLDIWSKLH